MRPHIFVTSEKINGLRSLDEVRDAIQTDHTAELWGDLKTKVARESGEPFWTPESKLAERQEKHIRNASREFELVGMTCNRILDAALAALILNERHYAESALGQMDTLFDEEAWPEIDDAAHLACGDHCSLRRGQLAKTIGLAYDWLHALLTKEERSRIVERFDARFRQPFRRGLEAPDRWVNNNNNFITVIFGGFGIAGMGFGEDYQEAEWLTQTCSPKMEAYVSGLLGPEGEFNENVGYAGSVHGVVDYLNAERYASGGKDAPFERHALRAFCHWYMHMTLPPGRIAAFGDAGPDSPPLAPLFAPLAGALRDPVLQWFYLQHWDKVLPAKRKRPFEILFYDSTVPAEPPDRHLPLGKAYHAQGRLISSRSSWHPESCASVVYAKAGREDGHGHPDWGQVCIDGHGERLIVDVGGTKGYPGSGKDYFYNYQQLGHNVPVFGDNDTGGVSCGASNPKKMRNPLQGHIKAEEFDAARGGMWTMDITEPYGEIASRVQRTVVHLLPDVVAVFDDIALNVSELIRLRWHTITPAEPEEGGRFLVQGDKAALAARVERVDGNATLALGRHEYRAPYDKDRVGALYPQLREPYNEIRTTDQRCQFLSLFAVFGPDKTPCPWAAENGIYKIETSEGIVAVSLNDGQLSVTRGGKTLWEVAT